MRNVTCFWGYEDCYEARDDLPEGGLFSLIINLLADGLRWCCNDVLCGGLDCQLALDLEVTADDYFEI